MLVVELDGALQRRVADDVAVCEILGEDTAAGLLLLCDLVRVALGIGSDMGIVIGRGVASGGDADMGGAELGAVQEQSCLGSGLLLEHDSG